MKSKSNRTPANPQAPNRIKSVGLTGIAVPPDRMRRLRPELVDELAESIRVQGLLHPIILRPRSRKGIGYELVVGRHRLEAVRKLKLDSIRAEIREGLEAEAAELAEIDENLIRADLTPAERAMHVHRRKEIYEKLHPETKRGATGRRGKSRQVGDSNNKRFTKETAAKGGQSERKVQRDATRGSKVKVLPDVAGTCLDQGAELDALGELSEDEQRKLADRAKAGEKVSAKTPAKQARRQEREAKLASKQLALPNRKYGVILADPEWRFEPWSPETGMDRAADNHFPTSCTEVIAARNVPSIAADDCVLFLWAIVPMLAEAFCVLDAWGFARFERNPSGILTLDKSAGRYVSSAAWLKYKPGAGIGLGHWFRVDHEILLVATRGNPPAPAPGEQSRSVFDVPASKVHSQKPELVLELIEQHYPTMPKIELNRRGPPRPGWDAWGNEVEIAAPLAPDGASPPPPDQSTTNEAQPPPEPAPPPERDPLDIPDHLRRVR